MSTKTLICVANAVLSLATGGVLGQYQEKDDTPTYVDRVKESVASDLKQASANWKLAMEALGSPPLLLSFGISNGSPQQAMGMDLSSDQKKFTDGLENQLGAYMFAAHAQTEIISPADRQSANERLAANLADIGADAVIEQVMRDLDVKYALVAQFAPQGDGTYLAIVRWVDPVYGKGFPVFSESVNPGTHKIDQIAAEIFKRVSDSMLAMSQRGVPKRNVVITGDFGRVRLKKIEDSLLQIDGFQSIDEVNVMGSTYKINGVKYDGSSLDLGYEIEDYLTEEHELRSRMQFSQGTLVITVYKDEGEPSWYQLTDRGRSDIKKDFENRYNERGSNRIAVMFNSYPAGADALESEIIQSMLNAGVNVVDSGQVFKSGGQSGAPALSQDEAIRQLRNEGNFDVLIVGDATQTTTGIPDATLRAISVDNGRLLGASSWPSREATSDPDYGVDKDDPQMTDVARFLAGSILDSYYRNQLLGGNPFDIKVDGVKSFAQANFIATSIESVVPNVLSVSSVRYTDGQASFSLKYEGGLKDLLQALQQKTSELPIQSEITDVGSGSLKLRAKPLESDG